MSVEALNWAFSQTISKSSTKLVLIALADFANDRFIAYPSYSTLEKKCSCSRSTIYKALLELKNLGFIGFVEQKTNIPLVSNNGQNCYHLIVRNSNQCENQTSSKIDIALVRNLHPGSSKITPKPPIYNLPKDKLYKPSYNHQYTREALDQSLHSLFDEYLKIRKSLKAKNTDHAINLLIKKLKQYSVEEQKEMLERSIMNSWKSVYPLVNKNSSNINGLSKRAVPINATFNQNNRYSDAELETHNQAVMKNLFGIETQKLEQGGQA